VPGVTYRFFSELRQRWRAWFALAMLVGAVAGTAIVLVAGSRRTGSAYERFASAQRAYDVGVVVSCTRGEPPTGRAEAGCHAAVARLPAVRDATTLSSFPASIETLDGRSIQPDQADACYSGPGDVETLFDPSGRFGNKINRSRFVAGRPANPAAADEVVISEETAHRLRLAPGRELRVRLLGGADCLDSPEKWRAPQRVRIVGVQLRPGEVRPPSGLYFQWLEVTPAFVRRAGAVPDRADHLVIRLRPGASPNTLRVQARRAGYQLETVVSQAESARAVERAIRPNQVSLAILGALTLLAGLVVIGQILVRQCLFEASDDGVLSALGMSSRERVMLAALRGGFVGAVAAVLAAAAAIATSPLMPIGLARRVEPARGFAVDLVALALGGLVTMSFVVGVSTATAVRLTHRHARRRRAKPATVPALAARAGVSPAAVTGTRFALQRGAGSTAVPVASSFAGLTIAVIAVVGSLTFGAGLTHLRETPRLVGWNWSLVLPYPEVADPTATSRAQERAHAREGLVERGFTEFAMGTVWPQFPQGRDLQLGPKHMNAGGFSAFDGTARVGPSVISGRKPAAWDEILLGPRTIEALGLHVGDRVDAFGQAGTWERPGAETSMRMRIVGTGLAPMTESLGRGATMTLEGLMHLNPTATEQALFVRLDHATDRKAVFDAFRGAFPGTARQSIDPFSFDTLPDAVLNLERIGSIPALFALIMGVMAAAVLTHVLAVGVRARRRDIAILRALGFTRGQTTRAIYWQSTIYALGALGIGLPVGVVLGRIAWRVYAANLGAVPEAVTPVAACSAVAIAALALAGLMSIAPGLRVARTRAASSLRTE
jgi:hypothetical protein